MNLGAYVYSMLTPFSLVFEKFVINRVIGERVKV